MPEPMAITDAPYPPGSPPGGAVPSGPLAAARSAALPPAAAASLTTLPGRVAPRAEPARKRRLGQVQAADALAITGALAAGLATTALLWAELSPFTGVIGYAVVSWGLFVGYYAILISFDHSRTVMRDRLAAVVIWSVAVLIVAAMVWIIAYTVLKAVPAMRHLNFFSTDMATTTPLDPLTKGGVLHAIVGTLIEVGIAMVIAVPLGLLAAVYLNEVPGPLNRLVRTVVDAMTALPDILAGLFIYATLILIFGLGLSGLAAGCALAVTIISIVCRAAYVVLRLVPGGLTEASYALGSGHWRTVCHVTLPTARPGLATAVSLGLARAIGETSPVLLTAGASTFLNANPVGQPMMSLPLLAYSYASYPQQAMIARGFGAAVVLMVLFVVLVMLTRMLGGRGAGQLTAGQARRRRAASERDLARISAMAAGAPGWIPAQAAMTGQRARRGARLLRGER